MSSHAHRFPPNDVYVAAYIPKHTRDKVLEFQLYKETKERRRVPFSEIFRNALEDYCERGIANLKS